MNQYNYQENYYFHRNMSLLSQSSKNSQIEIALMPRGSNGLNTDPFKGNKIKLSDVKQIQMLKTKYLQEKQSKIIKWDLLGGEKIISKQICRRQNSQIGKEIKNNYLKQNQFHQNKEQYQKGSFLKNNQKLSKQKISNHLSKISVRKNSKISLINNNSFGSNQRKNERFILQSKSARLNRSCSQNSQHKRIIEQRNPLKSFSEKDLQNQQNLQRPRFQSKNFQGKMNLYMNMVIQKSIISHNEKINKMKQESNYQMMKSSSFNNQSRETIYQNPKIYRKSQYLRELKEKIYQNRYIKN